MEWNQDRLESMKRNKRTKAKNPKQEREVRESIQTLHGKQQQQKVDFFRHKRLNIAQKLKSKISQCAYGLFQSRIS